MRNPSEIVEDGIVFSLGNFDGKSVFYDFNKMLIYLDAKGKQLFGKRFKIYKEDHEIIWKLANYIIRDHENCKKLNLDLDKGLLLTGPVGCGKTSIMKLLKHLVPYQQPYTVISCRNIVFSFNRLGYKVIENYGNSQFYCFDDLGVEPFGRHYGNQCNVLGEILLSRHDLFLKHKIKTHATTNLNAKELEDFYGIRVRSRMRQLFNLVAFDVGAKDKR